MSLRVLGSLLAAIAMLGSIPVWWALHHREAPPDAQAVGPTESTPPAGAPAPAEPIAPPAPAAEPFAPADGASPSATADLAPATGPARPEKPTPELVTGPDPGRSPLANRLNAPDGTVAEDLAVVRSLLVNHLLQFGAHPVGSNREITAQLSGRNPRRHAPLPPDTAAISAEGELLDRWGTPFFFHALSAREMEVRSAGPDREMFTADDATSTPAP